MVLFNENRGNLDRLYRFRSRFLLPRRLLDATFRQHRFYRPWPQLDCHRLYGLEPADHKVGEGGLDHELFDLDRRLYFTRDQFDQVLELGFRLGKPAQVLTSDALPRSVRYSAP